MATSPTETYVQRYEKYLKQKESPEDLRRITSTQATSIKLLRPFVKNTECKICKVLSKSGDLCKVLNQGLYHKYTSSQDYFYTRDINSLLLKKKKPFCIKYNDDLTFDECKERLKAFFKKKDALSLMNEIKHFYSKFQNFPRNFHPHFHAIINSNIRKHRRLEYIQVFQNVDLDEGEKKQTGAPKDSKKLDNSQEFDFMELLGNSFLLDNYKDVSNFLAPGSKVEAKKDTARSMKEVHANFKELFKIPKNSINDPTSAQFSNALYNKNYMLYSRRDSETAEDILRQIVNEFREVDFSRKSSVTLADKVLQQVKTGQISPKRITNRQSPTLKPRKTPGPEVSPTFQLKKNTLTNNNLSIIANLQQLQKQHSLPMASTKRASSNMKSNSQIELDSAGTPIKSSQSRLLEHRKTTTKITIDNINNDLALSRNKIENKLYQFRSTRSKSGGLRSFNSMTKTPTNRLNQQSRLYCDTQGPDSSDSRQTKTNYYINYNGRSPSPDRLMSKEDLEKPIINTEIFLQSKNTLDSPYCQVKRSSSNGPGEEFHLGGNTPSTRKKSATVTKRAAATPKKHTANPSINVISTTHNISSSNPNINHSINEMHGSPNSKFINPLRSSLGSSQPYYLKQRLKVEKPGYEIEGYNPVVASTKAQNSSVRNSKNSASKRFEHYRVATMSLSGRQQNLSDVGQGINSLMYSQNSLLLNKTQSQPQAQVQAQSQTQAQVHAKRKKITTGEAQIYAAKVMKRSSAIQNQISDPTEDKYESKSKKGLELNEGKYNCFKDMKSPSQDQILSHNLYASIATSTNRLKAEIKKNILGPYTTKNSSKDIKFNLKK